MNISVVIPAFNEEKLIGATLRSILAAGAAFGERGWTMEIVVCDNNSTDTTAGLARAAGARVVFDPVNQIARARNTGAAAAEGDWLIFVDADSQPTRQLFAEVAAAIESGRCLAGGSTVRMDRRSLVGDGGTGLWNLVSRVMKWTAGSFIFCQAAAFRQVGGFNLKLFASEEIDLSKRLKKLARQEGKKLSSSIAIRCGPPRASSPSIPGANTCAFSPGDFHPQKTTASRDACQPWYDGRR